MSEVMKALEATQLTYSIYAYLLAKGPQKPLYMSLEMNHPLESVLNALSSLEKVGMARKVAEDSDDWMALLPTPLMSDIQPFMKNRMEIISRETDPKEIKNLFKSKIDEQLQGVESETKEFENELRTLLIRLDQHLTQNLGEALNKIQNTIKKFENETNVLLSQWESEIRVDPQVLEQKVATRINKIRTEFESKITENLQAIQKIHRHFQEIISTSKQSSQRHLKELQEDLTSLLTDIGGDLSDLIRQSLERINEQLTVTLKALIDAEVKRMQQTEGMMTETRTLIEENFQTSVLSQFDQYLTSLSSQLIQSFRKLIEKTQSRLKDITNHFLKAHEETISERVEKITLVFADFSKEIADMKGELFSETGTNERLIASMTALENSLDAQFVSLLDQLKIFFENIWTELREVIQKQRLSTLSELKNFHDALNDQVKSIFLLNKEFWDRLSRDFQDSISELARLSDMLEQQLNLFMANQLRIISKTKDEQKRIMSQITSNNQEKIKKLLERFQKEINEYQSKWKDTVSSHMSELKEKHEFIVEQSSLGLNKMKQLVLDSLDAHSAQLQARLNERVHLFESNLSALQAQYQRFYADLENKINQTSGKIQNTIALRGAAIQGEIQQLLREQRELLFTEVEKSMKDNQEEITSYYSTLNSVLDDAFVQFQQLFAQLKSTIETSHSAQVKKIQETQQLQLARINQLFENIREKTSMLLNDLQARLLESTESLTSSYHELREKLGNQGQLLLEAQQKWVKDVPSSIHQEVKGQVSRLAEQIASHEEEVLQAVRSQKEQAGLIFDSLESNALGTSELFKVIKENIESLGVQVNGALRKNEEQLMNNMESTMNSLIGLSERQIEVSRYLLEVEVNTRRSKALRMLQDSTETLEARNRSQEEMLLQSITETVNGIEKTTTEWEENMLQTIAQSKESFIHSSEELQGRQKEQAQLVMAQLQQIWEEYRETLSSKLDQLLTQADDRLAEIIRRLEESSTSLSSKIQQLLQQQQGLMQSEVNSVEKEGFKKQVDQLQEQFARLLSTQIQNVAIKINEEIERLHDMIQEMENTISSQSLTLENRIQEVYQVTSHELSTRLEQIPPLLVESLQEISVGIFGPLEQKVGELTSMTTGHEAFVAQMKSTLVQGLTSSMDELNSILNEMSTSLKNFEERLTALLRTNFELIFSESKVETFLGTVQLGEILEKEIQARTVHFKRLITSIRSTILQLQQKLEPHFKQVNATVMKALKEFETRFNESLSAVASIERKYLDFLKQRVKSTAGYFSKQDLQNAVKSAIESHSPQTVFFMCTIPTILTKEFLETFVGKNVRTNLIIPTDALGKLSPEVINYIHSVPRLSLYTNDNLQASELEKRGIIITYDDKLLHYWVAESQVFMELAEVNTVKAFLDILKEAIWQGSRRASLSKLRKAQAKK